MGLIPVSKFVYNFLSSGNPRKRHQNIVSIWGLMSVRKQKNSNGKNENKEKGPDYDSGLPLRKETRKRRRVR